MKKPPLFWIMPRLKQACIRYSINISQHEMTQWYASGQYKFVQDIQMYMINNIKVDNVDDMYSAVVIKLISNRYASVYGMHNSPNSDNFVYVLDQAKIKNAMAYL